jgi:hypothetical protein
MRCVLFGKPQHCTTHVHIPAQMHQAQCVCSAVEGVCRQPGLKWWLAAMSQGVRSHSSGREAAVTL